MSDLNSMAITGRLTKDAELKTTANGNTVLKFSVANNTGYGDNKRVTFFNCDLWGKQAESLAQYLTKGKQVALSGEVSLREYSTDSGKRQSLDVRVNSVSLIGSKPAENNDAGGDLGDSVPF